MKRAISLFAITGRLVATNMSVQTRRGKARPRATTATSPALPCRFFFLKMAAVLLIYFFPGTITWLSSHM